MGTPLLAAEGIAITRQTLVDGTRRALCVFEDVSLQIARGDCTAIFGPSGAGKTSLLRLFNRLDEPSAGRILLDGVDLRTLDPVRVRQRVGMLSQQPVLFDQTVEANLAYPLRLQHQDLPRETAVALLDELGLPAELLGRHALQLSGGQQQRVALARALTLKPEVLLLDEPTSALDEESTERLLEALCRRNRETGLAIVMVSHFRDVLLRLPGPALFVHDRRVDRYADITTALRAAQGVAGALSEP